jgi:hypothetical protein
MTGSLAALQAETFAHSRPATAESFGPSTRLTADELESYLDRRVFAVVCSTRPDGRPHAAMTSYVRRDDVFWLPTVADSVRERNIRHQQWVSLVVAEGDRNEHVVVSIEGNAELVQPAGVPPDVKDQGGEWVGVWIRLTAQRVLSYGAPDARR